MATLTRGVGLLERAIGYALGSVAAVVPEYLARPTPCSQWDLGMLLRHVNDSLSVLRETVDAGPAQAGPGEADLVRTFRGRACALLSAWTAADHGDWPIGIGDRYLMASVVAGAGAIEIAVHGWDISQACGQRRPIPPALARDMLPISRYVVTEDSRWPQFAKPVAVPPSASPSDRLVAYLGRRPR